MQNSPRIILPLEATRGFDRGLLSGVARYSSLNGSGRSIRQSTGTRTSSSTGKAEHFDRDALLALVKKAGQITSASGSLLFTTDRIGRLRGWNRQLTGYATNLQKSGCRTIFSSCAQGLFTRGGLTAVGHFF